MPFETTFFDKLLNPLSIGRSKDDLVKFNYGTIEQLCYLLACSILGAVTLGVPHILHEGYHHYWLSKNVTHSNPSDINITLQGLNPAPQVQIAIVQNPQNQGGVVFSEKMMTHFKWLFGDIDFIDKAPIYQHPIGVGGIDPKTVDSEVMKGMNNGKPYLMLSVLIADPEAYYEKHRKDFIERMARAGSERPQATKTFEELKIGYKNIEMDDLMKKQFLVAISQEAENRVWTNLTQSTGGPGFFSGRSYVYNLEEISEEVEALPKFLTSLINHQVAEDYCSNNWILGLAGGG